MELALVCLAAMLASALTLFSGFGLGTLLMPVVALFFPLQIAIAMTALVHLANNLFKLALLGRLADTAVLWRFAPPAMVMAMIGAWLLSGLDQAEPWLVYEAFGRSLAVVPVKVLIGSLILVFVVMELSPAASRVRIHPRFLPLGGAISGFFGGLSGHQGAFRSMFLIKAGLDKQAFVATGVVLAVMVDVARLSVYGSSLVAEAEQINWPWVIAASLAAFAGAYGGKRLLSKVTMRFVQLVVAAALALIAAGLVAGLV